MCLQTACEAEKRVKNDLCAFLQHKQSVVCLLMDRKKHCGDKNILLQPQAGNEGEGGKDESGEMRTS